MAKHNRKQVHGVSLTSGTFTHLYSNGMSPCSLDKDNYAVATETWLCTGCGAPRPDVGSIDVQIQETLPDDAPLTFVNGCGVILARRDFLDSLPVVDIRSNVTLGTVRGASGTSLDDWSTVRCRSRLIVRGNRNVSYRQCTVCGRHVYFAMGSRYLYPAPLQGCSIFESDLYGLVLAHGPFPQLPRWPKVAVDLLRIATRPQDGLGDLT